jgi:hypothetical protein
MLGIVPHHIEATALGRAFGAEGAHNHMPPRFNGGQDTADVGSSILGACEEVKHGTIMPHIQRLVRKS